MLLLHQIVRLLRGLLVLELLNLLSGRRWWWLLLLEMVLLLLPLVLRIATIGVLLRSGTEDS